MDRKVGNLIKKFREEKGMSQEELAFESGTSQQQISWYEQNKTTPQWSRLCDIFEALGCHVEVVKD